MEADPLPESQDIPEGSWALGRDTWQFHRQFYRRVGRCARYREYTALLWAVRRGGEGVERLEQASYRINVVDGQAHVRRKPKDWYRIAHVNGAPVTADGSPIVVRGGWLRLTGVESGDWTPPQQREPRVWRVLGKPPPKEPKAPKAAAPEQQPVATPPPPPDPPPPRPRPITASTLKLGSPAAAKALADRLRRMGVQAHPDSNISTTAQG